MKNMIYQKGQAAILIVFVLGMVSLLISTSLTQTGFWESIMGRNTSESTRAFYAASSGVEEAFYRIQSIESFGDPGPETFELAVGEASAKVTVTGSEDARTIVSVGSYENFVRKVRVQVQNTSVKPGFGNAIHAGAGGLELRNQTEISGKDDADGNVYSNGFIKGAKNDYTALTGECKNAASKVDGSAWAVEEIEKLSENDSGICVTKEAFANSLLNCFVSGDTHSPEAPAAECPFNGNWVQEDAPEIVPLPDMGIDALKNFLNSRGRIFNGDCILDGSGGPSDCSEGTNTIGDLVVTGNLTKASNRNILVSGPVWVKGNVVFNSLGSIKLLPEITEISQMVVVDGTITSDSNVAFGSNQNAFLLFISTYLPTTPELCDDPAITLSSNTNSVLFYSTVGCLEVTANSTFFGAVLGERILVSNNSSIEYDPALASAIFGLTKSGGWQVLSFKEN